MLKPITPIIIAVSFVFLFVPIGAYADTITVDIAKGSSTPACASSNSCYSPYTTTISTGDAVLWKNSDSQAHTVTGGSASNGPSGVFDSSLMSAGSSYKFTFNDSGSYDYFCMLHPWMQGSVIVNSVSNLSKSIASITNDPNKLDWAIMFVTTTNKCYVNHEKALDFYTTLTQQYLNDFNLQHRSVFSECITDDIMPEVINRITKSGDLTIVIPDYLMSVSDRHDTDSLGHYGSWNIKTIVSQAETISPENKNTGWILSHELAHFALDWKKYTHQIMADAVHKVEFEYRDCKSDDTTLTHCAYLWETIQTPSGKWFPVMSPNYVIEIAESMKPKTTTSTNPNYSSKTANNPDSINELINEYGEIKKSITSHQIKKLAEYQKLHFESKLANAKLGSVLNYLKGVTFENGDYNVNIYSGLWMKGLHSEGESGMRDTIADINKKYDELKNLDVEIIKAKKLESEYANKLQNEKNTLNSPINDKAIPQITKSNNVEKLQNDKQERIQKEKDEQEKQLKKEVQTLQSKSYYQLDKFKKGNDDAEKSLKSIVTSTLEQKQKIDKAWDLLKINKNKLSEIETKYHTGDIRISIEQYEDAKKWYYFYDKNNVEMEIGNNLKEISKLIEESQPKTCFLMWCW